MDAPSNNADDWNYFQSLTERIDALKNRVRHFIGDAHWLKDGEWKESVIRSILRRHLPITVGVGTGFIACHGGRVSTQNDILLYDRTKPILFQDGDFVIVTPRLVLGLIEVKTKVENSGTGFSGSAEKLADNVELASAKTLASRDFQRTVFFGFFLTTASLQTQRPLGVP